MGSFGTPITNLYITDSNAGFAFFVSAKTKTSKSTLLKEATCPPRE